MTIPFAQFRKGIIVVAGVAGDMVALGLLHGSAQAWTIVVLNALTAAGVIVARNGPKPV